MAKDGQYSHGASQKSWAIDCLLHCCPTHLSREGASAAGWWPTSSQKHRLLQKVGRTGFDWWAVKFETNLIWIWSHLGFQLSFASRVSWPTVLATYHHAILNTLAARLNIDSSRGKSLCFWFSFGILQHKPRNINIINQHNEFQSVTQKKYMIHAFQNQAFDRKTLMSVWNLQWRARWSSRCTWSQNPYRCQYRAPNQAPLLQWQSAENGNARV